jgi:hypothetical protein
MKIMKLVGLFEKMDITLTVKRLDDGGLYLEIDSFETPPECIVLSFEETNDLIEYLKLTTKYES